MKVKKAMVVLAAALAGLGLTACGGGSKEHSRRTGRKKYFYYDSISVICNYESDGRKSAGRT